MTAETKPPAACLIGWPAAHSRSPLIHHYWLRTLGIAGGYVIEAVPPDEFQDFVFRLSLRGFVGANVTLPHKERALALSKPDERARAVGAANTLWYEDGELRSTNTDIEGFINNLDACAPGWDRAEDALVLGAGGSSRAVVFGLLERGIKRVHLANRTLARAQALAGQFGDVHPVAWEAIGEVLPRAGLLVNTTSLGMHGQPALRDRRRPAAAARRGRRSRLCAAANAVAGSRARRADCRSPTGSACCCTRRCAASNCGSASARRSPRSFARWSRPISGRFERRRCDAEASFRGARSANPESRDSGSGPSDHPGMTRIKSPARGRRSRRWC